MRAGGEQNTRLGRLESDIAEIKSRLNSLEREVEEAKGERLKVLDLLNGKENELGLIGKTDAIYAYVQGTDKLFGFCRKHWRTALKFGCGVVTAYGVSNPAVARSLEFVGKFFGL